MNFEHLMRDAIDLALLSGDDVPVGAIVLDPNLGTISRGFNTRERDSEITGHAEVNAIRDAIKQRHSLNLHGCVLITTLEPCPMCAFAVKEARISKLIFGAFDHRHGSAGSRYDILRDKDLGPFVEVIGGVLSPECSQIIQAFFSKIRSGDSKRIQRRCTTSPSSG